MDKRSGLLDAIRLLAFTLAALHLVDAASDGITRPPGLAWALALGTLVGAGLSLLARGPRWWLAWPVLVLLALPILVTWPAAAVSFAGLGVIVLVLLVTFGLAWETIRQARSWA